MGMGRSNKCGVGLAIHVDVVAIPAMSGQQTPIFGSQKRLTDLFVHRPGTLLIVVTPKRYA